MESTQGFSLSAQSLAPVHRYCGRVFGAVEIGVIRGLLERMPRPNRAELSRLVCDALGWLRPDGRRKDMACRVALLRMHRDGLIALPPPTNRNGNGRIRPVATSATDPAELVCVGAGDLGMLDLKVVRTGQESRLWNELIERYHRRDSCPEIGRAHV